MKASNNYDGGVRSPSTAFVFSNKNDASPNISSLDFRKESKVRAKLRHDENIVLPIVMTRAMLGVHLRNEKADLVTY